ncbi:MAG: bacterial proteasome activator family protein [Nocardioidaceae bacterium]|nr:bacterial proteasome activator family protein [Nocardioidaceae bacterium]
MSEQNVPQRATVIGPDGRPVEVEVAGAAHQAEHARAVTEPAKVMRIGTMIRTLLEEVKSAPLDEASRSRLREIHQMSVKELEDGLAPELVEELERLSLPFESDTPSEAELRIAQAQLVGWLEGLFHGIQTAIYAQQVAAQSQLQTIRKALPEGAATGNPGQMPPAGDTGPSSGGGMYL